MGKKVKTRSKTLAACDGLINFRELADRLNLSRPTLRKLIQEPGFPVEKRGSNGVPYEFDAAKAIEWKAEKDRRLEEERQAREAELAQFKAENRPAAGRRN